MYLVLIRILVKFTVKYLGNNEKNFGGTIKLTKRSTISVNHWGKIRKQILSTYMFAEEFISVLSFVLVSLNCLLWYIWTVFSTITWKWRVASCSYWMYSNIHPNNFPKHSDAVTLD